MKLLSVVISYNRLELLKQTLESYQATVRGPHKLLIVDNDSDPETRRWLMASGLPCVCLDENRYPGHATNLGWAKLLRGFPPTSAGHLLHRSDNDVEYLPGWSDVVRDRFEANLQLGQLGLRTLGEEGMHPNVGGNCVVRSSVFKKVRWGEDPWQPYQKTEDYWYTQAVEAAGYVWERVPEPCIVHHGTGTPLDDPYYFATWTAKGWGGY